LPSPSRELAHAIFASRRITRSQHLAGDSPRRLPAEHEPGVPFAEEPGENGKQAAPGTDPETAEALRLARRIVDLAADKLASDIVLLDIRAVSPIADYFVICTAGSERQTSAILRDLSDKLVEELGRKPLHTEGQADSGWVLLDYGDVILHIFSPAQRAFYDLEELWSAATPVVRMQ
jgi:ribosome-associated protein